MKKSTYIMIATAVAFLAGIISVMGYAYATGENYTYRTVTVAPGEECVSLSLPSFSELRIPRASSSSPLWVDSLAGMNIEVNPAVSSPMLIVPEKLKDFIETRADSDTLTINFNCARQREESKDYLSGITIKSAVRFTLLTPAVPSVITCRERGLPLFINGAVSRSLTLNCASTATLDSCRIDSLRLSSLLHDGSVRLRLSGSSLRSLDISGNTTSTRLTASGKSQVGKISWPADSAQNLKLILDSLSAGAIDYSGASLNLTTEGNLTVGNISRR